MATTRRKAKSHHDGGGGSRAGSSSSTNSIPEDKVAAELAAHLEGTSATADETSSITPDEPIHTAGDADAPAVVVESSTPQMAEPEDELEDPFRTPTVSIRGLSISSDGGGLKIPQPELPRHIRQHSMPTARPGTGSGIRSPTGSIREKRRPQLEARSYSSDQHGQLPSFRRPKLQHRVASVDRDGYMPSINRPQPHRRAASADHYGLDIKQSNSRVYSHGHANTAETPIGGTAPRLSYYPESDGFRYRPRLHSKQPSYDQHSIRTTSTKPYFYPWDPFATSIISSRSPSVSSHSSSIRKASTAYFRSRRIKKGETDRPELRKKHPKEIWLTIIPIIGIVVGLGLVAFLTWLGINSVVNHKYCSVFYEDFSHGLNPHIWEQEVHIGINGEFEQMTGNSTNAFIRDGYLVIKPTLLDADLITQDSIVNLTADGTCTSSVVAECQFASNVSANYIIPPIRSASLSTRHSVGITYGRVEVEAKLATGDWLLPSISMSPVNNTYGTWPRSGEMDIAMARGNNYTYSAGGNNIVASTLHWGPDSDHDGWFMTSANVTALHSSWPQKFHTYSIEWTEKYLFTYIDSRLMQAMYVKFDESLWKLGNFPLADAEGNVIADPWTKSPNLNAPFDQEFYLIMEVAVGGSTGWFPDGKDGKPWVDASVDARYDFWAARDQWLPTWEAEGAGEMVVRRVRMWKQCD